MIIDDLRNNPAVKDKIYYQNDNGILFCADCLEIMKHIPDKAIDLVLTDPPYGVSENYETFVDTPENLKNLVNRVIPELKRVGKVVSLSTGVKNMFFYPSPSWVLNWTTPAGTGRGPWGFCCWQPILVYGKDPYLSNGKGSMPDTFIHTETSEKNGHPCPKPIKVWEKILFRCSVKVEDIILDPFLGSGTTAVACERLGRKWIGVELEPKYCEIAKKRIEAEFNQIKMF